MGYQGQEIQTSEGLEVLKQIENSISILFTFNGIHDAPKRKINKLLLIMKIERSINVKQYIFFRLIIITRQYPKLDHILVGNT